MTSINEDSNLASEWALPHFMLVVQKYTLYVLKGCDENHHARGARPLHAQHTAPPPPDPNVPIHTTAGNVQRIQFQHTQSHPP
jgi:hypothetical protein